MDESRKHNQSERNHPKGTYKLPNVTQKASSFGRFLWASVGVIGTLSGVLGFYQFFTDDHVSRSAPLNSQEMIVAMVQNNSITVEEATRLASILLGDATNSTNQASESIQKISSQGSDKQKQALQLLVKASTRDEGLALLKEEAKTAEDWQTLARLAQKQDAELALLSIKNALSLAPENFESLTMLAKLQAQNEDFAAAMRSITTAELLAQTPHDFLLVALNSMDIARQALDTPAMEAATKRTQQYIDNYDSSIELNSFPNVLQPGEFRKHPNWISGEAYTSLASTYNFIDTEEIRRASTTETRVGKVSSYETYIKEHAKYAERALLASDIAISRYTRLLSEVVDEEKYPITKRLIAAQTAMAVAHYLNSDAAKGVQSSSANLKMVREFAESGDRRAIDDLPGYYETHARFLFTQKEFEAGLATRRRSVDLQSSFLKRDGVERLALKIAKLEFDYAIAKAMAGKAETIHADIDAYFTQLESSILEHPEDGDLIIQHAVETNRVAYLFVRDTYGIQSKEHALTGFDRSEQFIKSLINSDSPTHDQMHGLYYVSTYRGDIYNTLFDKESALVAYKKSATIALEIPPTEDEPNVIRLSQLDIFYRIGNLGIDESKQAIIDGLALAKELNKNRQLTTNFQAVLNELNIMAKEYDIEVTP